ncbi:MAG: DUF4386 domain-containing protein [Microthrixaceae bacterium]|nr:DUF4386 domain-containing protein [Microthrixaceae bacterium]
MTITTNPRVPEPPTAARPTRARPTTARPSTARGPMTPLRRAALIAGLAYIGTFLFSIPVKFGFWTDVLENPGFVTGAGSAGGVPMGAVFEVLTALTCVATAVALYSVAKNYSNRAALGFVTTRVMEAGLIFVGALSVLSVYTLRQDLAGTPGADPGMLATTGNAFIAMHDWSFLLGPGLMPVLNALLIGSVMYRSRLIPRWIPTVGLLGAPLLLVATTGALFGVWSQVSGPAALLALPIAIWEFSFGIYMTIWGFRTEAVNEVASEPASTEISET